MSINLQTVPLGMPAVAPTSAPMTDVNATQTGFSKLLSVPPDLAPALTSSSFQLSQNFAPPAPPQLLPEAVTTSAESLMALTEFGAMSSDTDTDDGEGVSDLFVAPFATTEAKASDENADVNPADLLTSIMEALNTLQKTLQKGETPDAELIKSLNQGLEKLAQLMGMPVEALDPADPAIDLKANIAAMLGKVAADAGTAPVPSGAKTSEHGALIEKLAELSKALGPDQADLANRLKTLASNLDSGRANTELMQKLGFDATLNLSDGEGDTALQTLVATKLAEKSTAPAQPFSAPVLDVPEALAASKPATADAPVVAKQEPEVRAPAPAERPVELAKAPLEPKKQRGEPVVNAADAKPIAEAGTAPNNGGTNTLPAPRTELSPAVRTVQAAYQTPHTQVNLPQMAYEIARQFTDGNHRFHIRLDPAELGRIDVRMDIDTKGTLNARLTVERAETLDLLQRDQRALEKALGQAGLDSSKTNLEFSLRQSPFGRQDQNGQGNGRGHDFGNAASAQAAVEEPVTTISAAVYRGTATSSGVNLFV